MKLIQILAFIWLGMYGHIAIYLKQRMFQGEAVHLRPMDYLTDPKFAIPAFLLISIGLGSWIIDAFLRQKFQLSEMTALGTILKQPVGLMAKLFVLWLSERTLADKLNYRSLLIWIIGTLIAIYGSWGLLDS